MIERQAAVQATGPTLHDITIDAASREPLATIERVLRLEGEDMAKRLASQMAAAVQRAYATGVEHGFQQGVTASAERLNEEHRAKAVALVRAQQAEEAHHRLLLDQQEARANESAFGEPRCASCGSPYSKPWVRERDEGCCEVCAPSGDRSWEHERRAEFVAVPRLLSADAAERAGAALADHKWIGTTDETAEVAGLVILEAVRAAR